MTPQESFYAEKESLPIKETRGRVCSEFVMCYPPGIPILAPGEEITDKDVYKRQPSDGTEDRRSGKERRSLPVILKASYCKAMVYF